LDFGLPLRFEFVFVLPIVSMVLASALATIAALAWRGAWLLPGRIHVTAVAAGALLFPTFLAHRRLFDVGG